MNEISLSTENLFNKELIIFDNTENRVSTITSRSSNNMSDLRETLINVPVSTDTNKNEEITNKIIIIVFVIIVLLIILSYYLNIN